LLGNELVAQNYAWSVIKRIGLDADCKLSELVIRSADAAMASPSMDKYPYVSAKFQPMPYGYRIRGEYRAKELLIDPLDGCLLIYGDGGATYGDFAVESHDAKIKLGEARGLAEPVAKKYAVGAPMLPATEAPPATKTNELMYVHPNGEMGGIDYGDAEHPARLRLAWVLYYANDDEIWIDAGDGKVLGGKSRTEDEKRYLRHMKSGVWMG